jgi:hypothetical protein
MMGIVLGLVSKPACIGSEVKGAIFFLQFLPLLENELWPPVREFGSIDLKCEVMVSYMSS